MRAWVGAAVLAVGFTVACGHQEQRDPAVAESIARAGAPPITAPRELATKASDPCGTLLTPSQLSELGLPREGQNSVDAAGAQTCRWLAAGPGSRSVGASVVLGEDLFVATYRQRITPVFRPHEVGGLPAVDSQFIENGPACTTTVGVADGQTLDVDVARGTFGDEREADACAISRRVAEEIVSTLPPR